MATSIAISGASENGLVGGAGSDAPQHPVEPKRSIDRRRLRGRTTTFALVAVGVASIGQAFGALVIGRLAESPSWAAVGLLAVLIVGAAVFDTIGRVAWSAAADRAEGKLRADLLDAVMQQPLSALTEQAVGEILDRVDDDTHEIGSLLRQHAWRVIRLGFVSLPLLIVAGFTWWPAFVLFPITGAAIWRAIKPPLDRIVDIKVREEEAWTDHAAATEEGVAARHDLRTSLGQAHALQRCARLAAVIHERLHELVRVEAAVFQRAGLLVHGLLAVVAIVGVTVLGGTPESTATLVTLFAVTVTFAGQIDQVAHHLPDLQAGVGALLRLRGLMAVEPEPTAGDPVPDGSLSIELRDLHFAYEHGSFALENVTLTVPAGTTCALVGRSGSGKSTLASLLSRAVEPEPGSLFLGGVDVTRLNLQELRSSVGVVTQRTEIIAGTLAENIAMFSDVERSLVADAVAELGLTEWVAALPDGLDTVLGPAGLTLSAGEEQLVAFARLLVRDVAVIVLDEATARMDPVTEVQVVDASRRLLAGRTGILIAHRLTTVERADDVAVLDAGRVVEHGARVDLAARDGAFRRLLDDARRPNAEAASRGTEDVGPTAAVRRSGVQPEPIAVPRPPRLARGIWNAVRLHPHWGLFGVVGFLLASLLGAYGSVTGWLWGEIVVRLQRGESAAVLLSVMVAGLVCSPLLLAEAIRRYPRWWIDVMLRVRTVVLVGQTEQHRLPPTPPGEVVARAMDSDRYLEYADRCVDFANGLVIVVVTSLLAGTPLAGAVLLGVMFLTGSTSAFGSPVAGRSADASSTARAGFGRVLVSALESIRTVKLSGATSAVHRHLRSVDDGRVSAAVREHRIQALLIGLPTVLVQAGVVAAWAIFVAGWWGLSTALLVSGAVAGFEWFGRVAGAVITDAPGTRAWQQETSRLAGGRDLIDIPPGIDLVAGTAPRATGGGAESLDVLELRDVSAIHDDGTVGVKAIDLDVRRGEQVLLLGRIGSGKSSLLGALAGLVHTTGSMAWNGAPIEDPEVFLRPGRVAYVAQIPKVLSGTFSDNITLGHDRDVDEPIALARLERDIADAGGAESLVGHRGVRLSGGQVQRLALARALATDSELLVADDVSSALDATTEIELWNAMRSTGRTVIGSTTKRAALERADRVVVLVDGCIADVGPWDDLARSWDHLAG